MADPLTINVQQGAKAAPAVYTVPGAVVIEPLSAFATFDGTAAAAAFRPALTFYSDAGLILARVFPGESVPAGGTADVTFAPFLGNDGDGLQFNIATEYGPHNSGDWLDVDVDDFDPASGFGISLVTANNTSPIEIKATNGSMFLEAGIAEGGIIFADAASVKVTALDGGTEITGPLSAINSTAAHSIGFFLFGTAVAGNSSEFTVFDGAGTPAPIFEVRPDGSIHGRAAIGAITWDL